jgi:23S rRNA (cytosine1962-C5)-methyltransferase
MRKISDKWIDYELIDSGDKEKLERWGNIVLRRPEPQALWHRDNSYQEWFNFDGHYKLESKNVGKWNFIKKLDEYWTINYGDLTFKVSPTNTKHTGLFPEQAVNWDYLINTIQKEKRKDIKVLNLFGYTGAASIAASYAGAAEVVHVDASKHMVNWAKENMCLSNLENNKIRFIVDDVMKFVDREIRRDNHYDIIIMDPPTYGHGPKGEKWILEEQIINLIEKTALLLSDEPILFLVNSYTLGFPSVSLNNILIKTLAESYPNGTIETGELNLHSTSDLLLPCGIYGKWMKND